MDYKRYEPLFGSWYIDRVIGSGSFGTVYEIRRQDFSVEYRAALKVIAIPNSDEEIQRLRLDGMKKKEIQAYFREKVETITQEVELMSKLKGNSNIVSYEDHQVIQHQDSMGWDILIRMELLTPLMKSFKEHQLTRRDVIQLGIDICRALELCQKYHIIHRDIKVDNIFVSPTGDYKLGDFGIARQLNHAASELSRKGTYAYMAPEVYHGAPYGTGVDLYSLGLVLHRLLNHNRMPFMPHPPYHMTYSDRERAVARRMNGEALPAPFGVEPESRLAEIVLMACQYNPKDRYSSATQMREDLQAILYTEGERAIIYPDGRDVLNMPSSSYAVTGNQSEENTETEIMRESVAIAIFLLNYRNIENKRWLRYYLFSLLSISFHYSAIIICVFPLVRYLRLNLIYIIGCIAILFSLPIFDFMVEILPFKSITMRIDQYIRMRETFNMNWIIGELIKSIAPPLTALIIYRVAKLKLREEPMILLQIIFCIGFFSIPIIFSRFTNYTSMFVTVALANLISNTSLRNWVKATVIGIILVSQTPYYISMYRTWFPYVSIFNPKTLPDRENRWKNEFLKSY